MREEVVVVPPCSPCLSLQYGSGIGDALPATHDISRVSYHVKQLDSFTQTLEAVRRAPHCTAPLCGSPNTLTTAPC